MTRRCHRWQPSVFIPRWSGTPVGRCAITAQDPDTGRPDGTRTLEAIGAYRGARDDGYFCFGVYAAVVRPGRIAVGDPVVVDDDDDGV